MTYNGSYRMGDDKIEILPGTVCSILYGDIGTLYFTGNIIGPKIEDGYSNCLILKPTTSKGEPIRFKLIKDNNMYQCISCVFNNINRVVNFTITLVDDV